MGLGNVRFPPIHDTAAGFDPLPPFAGYGNHRSGRRNSRVNTAGSDIRRVPDVGPNHRRDCWADAFPRCLHPGQQQGRRFPSVRLEQPHSIRLRLVSGFFADSIQQIHSLRASGVISPQVARAPGWTCNASSKSPGRSWTTPPGMPRSPAIRLCRSAALCRQGVERLDRPGPRNVSEAPLAF